MRCALLTGIFDVNSEHRGTEHNASGVIFLINIQACRKVAVITHYVIFNEQNRITSWTDAGVGCKLAYYQSTLLLLPWKKGIYSLPTNMVYI